VRRACPQNPLDLRHLRDVGPCPLFVSPSADASFRSVDGPTGILPLTGMVGGGYTRRPGREPSENLILAVDHARLLANEGAPV
jgi:hypothetical protein